MWRALEIAEHSLSAVVSQMSEASGVHVCMNVCIFMCLTLALKAQLKVHRNSK